MLRLIMLLIGVHHFVIVGSISLCAIAKLFRCNRVLAASLAPTSNGIISRSEYEISKMLYTRSAHYPLKLPVIIRCDLLSVGSSSLQFKCSMHDVQSGECYATVWFLVVLIDANTRTPAPLPENIRSNLLSVISPKPAKFPDIVARQQRVTSLPSCQHEVKVVFSDLDDFGHVNNAAYLRMCLDCAMLSIQNGHLKHFHDDVDQHKASKVSVLYVSEAFVNDILDVHIWEDSHSGNTLHFQVKRSNAVSCYISIEFHQLYDAKL